MKKIVFVMPLMAISLLASCGGKTPEPTTVKHKLHFNGMDCILLDENKKQVTEDKEFVSGQIIYYFIAGKNIEYDVPKQDIVDVTLIDGGEFSGTWRYSETDGSITIKMTADVTINARSVKRPEDDFKVDEQEMKDAYAMKDVEYLQTTNVNFKSGVETYKVAMNFTPTSNHVIYKSPSYYETLIIKDGENYHQYERSNEGNPFTPTEYTGKFLTISEFAEDYFLKFKNIKYEDYYYNVAKKEYMAYLTQDSLMTVILSQFYNKQINKCAVSDYTSGNLTRHEFSFSYDKIEPPSPTI
ncbi:MAG: hypothetical protein MJ214_01275 [Bacilli bacterium]|nr:hypothetical protein [Bacilli bacterium]